MSGRRRIDEAEIRTGVFSHVETTLSRREEIDVYRAEGLRGGPIEIRVYLAEERSPARREPLMVYSHIEIADPEGRDVRIAGEDGRVLDEEMAEVLAWEMIEYESPAETYTYGREPGRIRKAAPVTEDADLSP
jgi:hypothetical protein